MTAKAAIVGLLLMAAASSWQPEVALFLTFGAAMVWLLGPRAKA